MILAVLHSLFGLQTVNITGNIDNIISKYMVSKYMYPIWKTASNWFIIINQLGVELQAPLLGDPISRNKQIYILDENIRMIMTDIILPGPCQLCYILVEWKST